MYHMRPKCLALWRIGGEDYNPNWRGLCEGLQVLEVGHVDSATGAKKFLEGFSMAYVCMFPCASELERTV